MNRPQYLEPISLQSSIGPHSGVQKLADVAEMRSLYNTGGTALHSMRPMSRVVLIRRRDPLEIGTMASKLNKHNTLQATSRLKNAKKSPYLKHMPIRQRESYLFSIGSTGGSECRISRLEQGLKSQLSKIISPIKAPAAGWKQGNNYNLDRDSKQASNLGKPSHNSNGRRLYLDDESFLVSPVGQEFSGEDELWMNQHDQHFAPSVSHTAVDTPMSDISDFDREMTPGQFSHTASTSSGMYGELEDEFVQGGQDDYEFILTEKGDD